MEPVAAFGIATGVIGLVPLCANGFAFIEGLCKAYGGVQEQMVRIGMQRASSGISVNCLFAQAWGEIWEIPFDDADRRRGDKFRTWFENHPELGKNVFRKISAISDVLADTKDLEKKYGIVLKRKNPVCYRIPSRKIIRDSGFQALRDLGVKDLLQGRTNSTLTKNDISARKRHMSIVQRCSFQLTGEEQFDRFVAKLREFMDDLWKICSETQAEKIERALLQQVAENKDVATLQQVSKVYGEEAGKRRRRGVRHQGYDLVREVADFKAKVQALSSTRARETSKRQQSGRPNPFLLRANRLDAQDLTYQYPHWQFADGKATLAKKRNSELTRYVEWKSYTDGEGDYDPKAENDIMELADLFSVEKRPEAFQVLPFIGILRPEKGLRFGFVFQPPPYIENIDSNDAREHGIGKPRLPRTLLEHIEEGAAILPLGDRFNMARKLARSLYVLHATGWVHKK
ncbi:MAG: hypothetical protein Q9184_003721 [Pyrenodesmia sp. 2 TL-2023]